MQRDLKLDGLKSVLIFLVVLGHLDGYDDFGLKCSQIIYSFHMPVFVFISGYLTSLKPNKQKHISWIKHTLLLYIIAQAAHVLMLWLLGSPISWKMVISPQYTLWYLLCLVYWRVLIWTVLKDVNDNVLLISSVILAILSGFIPLDQEFSFQRTFAFSPFFFLGVVFKKRDFMAKLEKISIWPTLVVLAIGLIIAYVLPFGMFMPRLHYVNWHKVIIRVVQSSLAFLLCVSIIRVSRCRFLEVFSKFGTYTLWIYIGHSFLVEPLVKDLWRPLFNDSYTIFVAIVLAIIIFAFFVILARLYEKCSEKLVRKKASDESIFQRS